MKKYFIVIFTILLVSSILSCSDSERRLPYVSQYATVKIKMTLPDEAASSQVSIIDRILRLISRDAIAQTAPATFSSIRVVVTASDMTTIDRTFTPTETITLTVPGGLLRRFEVTAYVDPSDPSAAQSFRGVTILPLTPGETINLPVIMNLHETKIVIPDPGPDVSANNRLIQINSMSDAATTWKTLTVSGITGLSGYIRPWDVDFDSRGRIYVANNYGGASTGANCVFRIDNINGGTAYLYPEASARTSTLNDYGITSVAVDKLNNYVYYSFRIVSTQYLWRSSINDNTSHENLLLNVGVETINNIRGMGIDSVGILYIVGQELGGGNRVFQYNPVTQTVMKSFGNGISYLISAEDVIVKPPYIYIANTQGTDNYKIIQLDLNLHFIAGYGSSSISSTDPGYFYGPRRFLAIRNDSLIIIDEDLMYNNFLISINDIIGTGWYRYGAYGSGDGQFRFFYGC